MVESWGSFEIVPPMASCFSPTIIVVVLLKIYQNRKPEKLFSRRNKNPPQANQRLQGVWLWSVR